MAANPLNFLSIFSVNNKTVSLNSLSNRFSPQNKSKQDLTAIVEGLVQQTLKQAIERGRAISSATYNATKNFFTSDQISMKMKTSVVFAAVVLCASPTLRYTIPTILSPVAGAAASAVISAFFSATYLMYITVTKLAPLALQLLSSQTGNSRSSAAANSQQNSSSETSTNNSTIIPKKDHWSIEFQQKQANDRSSADKKSSELSLDTQEKKEAHASTSSDQNKDGAQWAHEYSEQESTLAAAKSSITPTTAPSLPTTLEQDVQAFIQKKDAFAVSSDTIEQDVQAFQALSAQENNIAQTRAVSILTHLLPDSRTGLSHYSQSLRKKNTLSLDPQEAAKQARYRKIFFQAQKKNRKLQYSPLKAAV